MDIDPLADTAPPRHVLESDESDDDNPINTADSLLATAKVEIIGNLQHSCPLIVAKGDAAKYWAKGADLGDKRGSVMVNGIEVGFVFFSKWTRANVIISELPTRLPWWAMHKYALTILDTLKPSTLALLDVYQASSYVTTDPMPLHEAPIRYLSVSPPKPFIKLNARLFSPPNLLRDTSASFLAILATTHTSCPGVAILLPSPDAYHPVPRKLMASNATHLSAEWSDDVMSATHALLSFATEQVSHPEWNKSIGNAFQSPGSMSRNKAAENGMYI